MAATPSRRGDQSIGVNNLGSTGMEARYPGNFRENSLYYLHPSENPASVLVTPLLNSSNYHSWSKAMQRALRSKKKWTLVNGSVTPPDIDDEDYLEWEGCNNMLISWIMASVEPSIAQSINGLDTVIEVWNDLKERFGSGDSIQLARLQMQLCTLKQGALSVNDYFTSFRTLWDQFVQYRPVELCKCVEREKGSSDCASVKSARLALQQDQVIKFLIGLNENFDNVRSQIMMMDPLPTMSRILYLALQHEQQLLENGQSSIRANATNLKFADAKTDASSSAISAAAATGGRGNFGNYKRNWNDKRPVCTFCGKEGHTIDKCYRKHGFPPNFKFTRGPSGGGNSRLFAGSAQTIEKDQSSGLVTSNDEVNHGQQHLQALGITADQLHGLLALLQQGTSTPKNVAFNCTTSQSTLPSTQVPSTSNNNFTGPYSCEGDW